MIRNRTGFTLIELVASAILSVMLMVALMNIVWSTARDTQKLKQDEVTRASVTLLVDRLRVDFQNARGMQFDATGVTLHGFLARDLETLQLTMLPARVRYEVVSMADRRVLVRESASLREPVWFGFGAILITPLVQVDGEDTLTLPETGGLAPVPASFRVTLTGQNGQVLWREVIDHHAS